MKWTGSEFCYLKTSRNELQQLTYSLKKIHICIENLKKYKQNVIFQPINTFLDVTKVWHHIASLNDIAREKPKKIRGRAPGRYTISAITAPHSRPFGPQLSEFFPVLMSEKTVLEGKYIKRSVVISLSVIYYL